MNFNLLILAIFKIVVWPAFITVDQGLVSWSILIMVLILAAGGVVCFLASRRHSPSSLSSDEAGEEKYRQLFEMESDAIFLIDNETYRILEANQAAAKMYGYTHKELLQKKNTDLSAEPEDTRAAVREQRPRVLVRYHRKKDGSVFPVEITGCHFTWKGKPVHIAAIRDITERLRAEETLRSSEERYRKIFEEMLNAFVIFGVEHEEGTDAINFRFLEVNKSFCVTTNFKKEDVIGKEVMEVFPNIDPSWIENFRTVVRTGQPLRFEKYAATLEKYFEGVAYIPSPRQLAFSFRDITDRKRTEAEKKLLEDQLLQSQKMEAVGQLAGGIAHDFNNLLSAIIGYSDLVVEKIGADDPAQKYLTEIQKAGERASSLINQLLAFSRKQLLLPEIFCLNDRIQETKKMLRRLIGETISLETDFDPNLGSVKADPVQVEQVIVNLAINARDAMPEGGTLTIRTSNVALEEKDVQSFEDCFPGRYVQLTVRDTGCGIEPAVLPRIFEPFFTTKEQGKGTGLGLSTVFGIVKQSGGFIGVKSERGKGTTFHLYFPVVEASEESEESAIQTVSSGRGNETVLVVEDEDVVREFVSEAMTSYGYTVLEANNGLDAIRICQEQNGSIHLLLTDLVMPGISGQELATKLRSLYPDMKMMFMSGYAENEIFQEMIEPAISFLPKPFTPKSLIRKVREVLDSR